MKLFKILIALALLGMSTPVYAAAPPAIRMSVAVCDPNAPTTCVAPNAPTTNVSGTVATGATFQSLAVASTSRKGCLIQNPIGASETLFVFFGPIAGATTAKSVGLAAGSSVSCLAGGTIISDQISVTATTTSHAFMAFVQ